MASLDATQTFCVEVAKSARWSEKEPFNGLSE